jgi:hypothetical protein
MPSDGSIALRMITSQQETTERERERESIYVLSIDHSILILDNLRYDERDSPLECIFK